VQTAYLLVEAGGNVHIKNRTGLNALNYTRGPLRRAQLLRRWELLSAEGRANTAALADEGNLVALLRQSAEHETSRIAILKVGIRGRMGTFLRVFTSFVYRYYLLTFLHFSHL
jgi:hypothetical protein